MRSPETVILPSAPWLVLLVKEMREVVSDRALWISHMYFNDFTVTHTN